MRVMHVLAPARAGGLERVVHALTIGQRRSGLDAVAVPIVESWSSDHPFAVPLARAGVPVEPVLVHARAYAREWRMLDDLFRRAKPTIVHTHNSHADVLAGIVARRAGILTVATAHGFTRGSIRNHIYEYIDRLAFRRFAAVAAVSRPLADELRRAGIPADRLHIVPNAWSPLTSLLDRDSARRALGLPVEGFVAGWVGRMTFEKGLDLLVEALPLTADLTFTVCAVGDGPERQKQQARATTIAPNARIAWTGLVLEAERYFSAFDALVISSRTEGTPMVMFEAMASGIPIVAAAVGGIPDVLSPNEAVLVDPLRPEMLANAIRSIVVDPEAAAGRAQAAKRRLSSNFTERTWLERYEEVYRAARECHTSRNSTERRHVG